MVFNWEPLELNEDGSYMVVSLGPANNFTGKVLDSLEFNNVRLWCITLHWREKALIMRIKVRLSKQCLKWFIGPNSDIQATVSVTWSLKVKSYLAKSHCMLMTPTVRWLVLICIWFSLVYLTNLTLKLTIDNVPIKQVSSLKSLGIYIDENLTWHCYID